MFSINLMAAGKQFPEILFLFFMCVVNMIDHLQNLSIVSRIMLFKKKYILLFIVNS